MTGIAEHNFPAFHAAAAAWRAAGWDVVNPAESFAGRTDLPYAKYVAQDLEALATCDAIAMLPGWNAPTARGSVWEHVYATQALRLRVFDAQDVVPPPLLAPSATHTHTHSAPGLTWDTVLPTDATARKAVPLVRGCLDYFPAALAAVAEVSRRGNEQHNPGQPMHHARGKSSDHADCLVRHLVERGTLDADGLAHTAKVAWRALALLQEELEAAGAPLARGARLITIIGAGADA